MFSTSNVIPFPIIYTMEIIRNAQKDLCANVHHNIEMFNIDWIHKLIHLYDGILKISIRF